MRRCVAILSVAMAGFLLAGCGEESESSAPRKKKARMTLEERRKIPPPKEGPAVDAAADAMKLLDNVDATRLGGEDLAKQEAAEKLKEFEEAFQKGDLDAAEACLKAIEKNVEVLPDSVLLDYRDAKAKLEKARAKAAEAPGAGSGG